MSAAAGSSSAARLREQADVHKHDDDLERCDRQILDLLQVWDLADSSQRARLVAGIFTEMVASRT